MYIILLDVFSKIETLIKITALIILFIEALSYGVYVNLNE